MSKHTSNLNARAIFGIGLIIFAVLLFLSNIGIPFLGAILRNWPILLIIVGVILLRHQKEHPVANGRKYLPHALIGAGILFQLANMHILNFGIGALLLPVLLVFAGFQLLRPPGPAADTRVIEGECDLQEGGHRQATSNGELPEDTKIDVFTLLGGGDFATRSNKLSGGNVVAILGGADIDLRQADSQGDLLELQVIALMGGVEIKVPPHFQVTIKVLPLLGGVGNRTTCLADKLGVPPKQLVITGLALMGGIDVRN